MNDYRLGRAAAADLDLHVAAAGSFAHQPGEFLVAFHALAVITQHHVADLQSGLFRGTVLLDQRQLDADGFTELQCFGALRVDLLHHHADIAAARGNHVAGLRERTQAKRGTEADQNHRTHF